MLYILIHYKAQYEPHEQLKECSLYQFGVAQGPTSARGIPIDCAKNWNAEPGGREI